MSLSLLPIASLYLVVSIIIILFFFETGFLCVTAQVVLEHSL